MDFITHSLVGAGVARLVCPKKEWLPQLTLAGLLGSLAMDGDSWLAFVDQDAYGLYHRVLTHNVFALGALALAGGVAARAAGGLIAISRRFGLVRRAQPLRRRTARPRPVALFLHHYRHRLRAPLADGPHHRFREPQALLAAQPVLRRAVRGHVH